MCWGDCKTFGSAGAASEMALGAYKHSPPLEPGGHPIFRRESRIMDKASGMSDWGCYLKSCKSGGSEFGFDGIRIA